MNGSDDSDFLLFSWRWSKFQSEGNFGRDTPNRSDEPLTTVGQISFDFLWNGLCLEDLEGWTGWRMAVGDIFHGIGPDVRVAWSLVPDISMRLAGGSGEGDRPWADKSEALSSSISLNRLCKWMISHRSISYDLHAHTFPSEARFEALRSFESR